MNTILLCMHGLSGSGKSTAARFLANATGVPVYHSDVERKKLFGLTAYDSSHDSGIDIYTPEATRQTFQKLYTLAHDHLALGQSVIVDAAFLKHQERQTMQQLADEMNTLFLLVKCQAKDEMLYDRIKKRQCIGNDASEATEELISKQKGWLEGFSEAEQRVCLQVLTDQKNWQDKMLQGIYHYIS